MVINLTTKRITAISQQQRFLSVLPTRWRQKSAGIDMEQNYVTVTLCIILGGPESGHVGSGVQCWTQPKAVLG